MNSGRGHACHDQSILFFWWIVTVLIRLYTEPVSIKLVESERFVQCTGIVISLYNLKVCILRTFLNPFFQKSGTDLACIAVFAILFFYMDGIDPDVISVQNAESGCNDLAVHTDAGADSFFEDRLIHGWNDFAVNGVGSVL